MTHVPLDLPASRLRFLFAVYIAAIALVTCAFALQHARVAHPWVIGEWLLNYSGGFVRRGLLGEGLLLAHRATALPLVGLTAALQVLLYLAFYASLLPLLRGVRWSLALAALLLSPATLAFTVLDPPTSMRKEVLLFLALSLLINALLFLRPRPWQLSLGLSLAAPVLLLTHEALAAFLPYLFLPLLVRSAGSRTIPRLRDAGRVALIPLLLSALALAAVLTHPGDRRQAQAVCSSVGGHLDGTPGGLCNGAIAYLALAPVQARAETLRAILFYSYRTRYPVPILLTALPIVLLVIKRLRADRTQADRLREHGGDPATRRLLLVTGIAILASLPLFVVARDWGRWIEIHATCLLLLFLLLERLPRSSALSCESPLGSDGLLLPATTGPRMLRLVALALYAICWTLPAVGIFPGRFGYIDLLRYLHSYGSKPHLSTAAASIEN